MTTATTTKTEYRYRIQHSGRINESPRDWDNVGTMALFHSSYKLPNESLVSNRYDYNSWDEIEHALMFKHAIPKNYILPVYMLVDDGITINTAGFKNMWDGGQIGFIFIDKTKLRRRAWTVKEGISAIKGEVLAYDQYLQSDVYDILLYRDEKLVESSCNYYGYGQAKCRADEWIELLKGLIK